MEVFRDFGDECSASFQGVYAGEAEGAPEESAGGKVLSGEGGIVLELRARVLESEMFDADGGKSGVECVDARVFEPEYGVEEEFALRVQFGEHGQDVAVG